MYNTYVIDVHGVKLGYFPSCVLMFPASRRKTLAVVVSRCSFPPGFTGHGGAKRSDAVRLVRRAVNVDAGIRAGWRTVAARVSGTVVPKYIVAVGRAGDRRGTRRTKDAIIG